MYKISYYIVLILFVGCISQTGTEVFPDDKTTVRLVVQQIHTTRTVDEDNPLSEQVVKNISLFLTEPSSTTITHKYVYTGFSFSGDNGLVTLPLEVSELLTKNIYVIANYDDEDKLNAVETLDNMRDLLTPKVNKTNNFNPANGFCMYGSTLEFDFTNEEGNSALVTLVRTCAKFRVNVDFVEDAELSTNNSFLMQNAAMYTYVINNPTAVLPLTDYFNFAAPTMLVDNGANIYTNVAYLYEANGRPTITIYTHINNSIEAQEFTAILPIPRRNYFYDLLVEIYEEENSSTRAECEEAKRGYTHKCTLRIYNEKGEEISEE